MLSDDGMTHYMDGKGEFPCEAAREASTPAMTNRMRITYDCGCVWETSNPWQWCDKHNPHAPVNPSAAPAPLAGETQPHLRAVLKEALERLDDLLTFEDLDAENACEKDLPELADFLRRELAWSPAGETARERIAAKEEKMTGAELIAAERQRQIDVEGYPREHDAFHRHADLAVNAARLAVDGTDANVIDQIERSDWGLPAKHRGNRVRQLVIAGALIAAEIDRLRSEGRDA